MDVFRIIILPGRYRQDHVGVRYPADLFDRLFQIRQMFQYFQGRDHRKLVVGKGQLTGI